MTYRSCPCGSGQGSWWELDGNGIEIGRACTKCVKQVRARVRPRLLKPYTVADVDEPIEES